MKKQALIIALLLLTVICPAQTNNSDRWKTDISAFKVLDSLEQPEPGGVVFTGSSSIRMWKNLSNDFKGINVLNRGFGGSQIPDIIYFADDLIFQYRPSKVVLYSGDNDLASGKSPQQVINDYRKLTDLIHSRLPDTKIYILAVKPSESRWNLIEKIKQTNLGVKKLAQGNKKLTYIDVFTPMIGKDGMPMKELFLEDQLHMNEKGYEIWKNLVLKKMK